MKFLLTFVLALVTVFASAQTSPTVRFDSIADMVAYAIPTPNNKLSAIVSGKSATGDSFLAGEFAYNAASTATTNTYAVFKPISTTGRWIRITAATYNQTPNITIPSAEDSYAFQLYRGVGTNALSIGATGTNAIIQSFTSLPLFINPVGANNVVLNELGGNVGVGIFNPLASLDLRAGSATRAPLKFHAGINLTTPQAGAVEYNGTNLFITTDDLTRNQIAFGSGASGLNFDTTQFTSGTNISVKSGSKQTNNLFVGNIGVNVITPATEFHVGSSSTSTPRGIMSAQYSTGTDSAHMHMRKARGTEASPLTVVTGDILGRLIFAGYEGTGYLEMAGIRAATTGTIGANRIPTQLIFSTATDAAPSVLTDRMWLAANGGFVVGQSIAAPTHHLTVNPPGNVAASIAAYSSGNAGGRIVFGVSGDFNAGIGYSQVVGGAINISTGGSAGSVGTSRILVTTTGEVGINTTVPGAFGLAVNHAIGDVQDWIYNDSDGSPANHMKLQITSGGNGIFTPSGGMLGIGVIPTAHLTLTNGTATAGTAPLKIGAGTVLASPEPGAIEYDGTSLFYTDGTSTRRTLSYSAGASIGDWTFGTGTQTGPGAGSIITVGALTLGTSAGNANIIIDPNGTGKLQYNISSTGIAGPFKIVANETGGSGTNSISWYPDDGTTTYGAGISLYGYAHASKPGQLWLGYGGTGNVTIGNGSDAVTGTGRMSWDGTSARVLLTTTSTTPTTGALRNDGGSGLVGPVSMGAKLVYYNNVITAGGGAEVVRANGRAVAQTAAVASVATFTPASDATVQVSCNVLVTTSSAEAFTMECTFTDEGNTARTLTLPLTFLTGAYASGVNFATGANAPYAGSVVTLRLKGGTACTVRTSPGGIYTGCTFNVEGNITQLN